MILDPALLVWDGDQPRSVAYGDIYHAADGLAESLAVFIGPARLAERARRRDRLTIAELGFGTGLNFAASIAEIAAAAPDAHAHYVAVEKHPLAAADMEAIAARRRHRLPVYAELARVWPPLVPGWHRRRVGRVTLSLYFGDVRDAIASLGAMRADAWFLDGFAPDRNPDMWSPAVLAGIGRHAAAGASVTTFSAAGAVRRGLSEAGFEVARLDQRPRKRHTLLGWFDGVTAAATVPRAATVIGAGIAGCATARALADRGLHVRLADGAGIAGCASGIPAAMVHGRLLGTSTALARLRLGAYRHAAAWYAGRSGFRAAETLQLPGPTTSPARLEAVAERLAGEPWLSLIGAAEAARRAGVAIAADALSLRGGGHADLGRVCRELAGHPGIAIDDTVVPLDDLPPGLVVVCAGEATRALCPGAIRGIGGQIDRFAVAGAPRLPLIGNGYVVPEGPGRVYVGASYEHQPWDPEQATRRNAERVTPWLSDPRPISRWRGVRAVCPDRLPLVGALRLTGRDDVYVNAGHGSQGAVLAPLAAEMIASHATGEAPAADPEIDALLDPARFARRHELREERRALRHRTRAR